MLMTSYRPLKPGSLEKEVDVETIAKAIRAGGLPVSSIDKLDSQFNGVVGLTWGATGWHGPPVGHSGPALSAFPAIRLFRVRS